MLSIKPYPYPTLKQKCRVCKEDELPLIKVAAKEMIALCEDEKHLGAGLAANQVGLDMRFFILKLEEEEQVDGLKEWMCVINPIIMTANVEDGYQVDKEKCLSIEGIRVPVRRFCKLVVRFYDEEGKSWELKLEDTLARCFQHEYDHIDGVTIIDHMQRKDRGRSLFKQYMRKLKKLARAVENAETISAYDWLTEQVHAEEIVEDEALDKTRPKYEAGDPKMPNVTKQLNETFGHSDPVSVEEAKEKGVL